jgi:hypothetical protein
MYNITYISDIDRKRLVILNDALRMVGTIEEQQEIREEISEIESKRKPLHACTLLECSELRTAIWEKFDMLNRTGKYGMARNFKLMLQQIEIRQGIIHREMAFEEEKRNRETAQEKAKHAADIKQKLEDRREESNDTMASSRWTTGIGRLD